MDNNVMVVASKRVSTASVHSLTPKRLFDCNENENDLLSKLKGIKLTEYQSLHQILSKTENALKGKCAQYYRLFEKYEQLNKQFMIKTKENEENVKHLLDKNNALEKEKRAIIEQNNRENEDTIKLIDEANCNIESLSTEVKQLQQKLAQNTTCLIYNRTFASIATQTDNNCNLINENNSLLRNDEQLEIDCVTEAIVVVTNHHHEQQTSKRNNNEVTGNEDLCEVDSNRTEACIDVEQYVTKDQSFVTIADNYHCCDEPKQQQQQDYVIFDERSSDHNHQQENSNNHLCDEQQQQHDSNVSVNHSCGEQPIVKHSKILTLNRGEYLCDLSGCGFKTKHKYSFDRHNRNHKIACDCLNNHKIRCDWNDCGYKARDQYTLRRHKRTHTGEKPYKCEWHSCAHRFRQRSHLNKHLLWHKEKNQFHC